MIEPSKDNGLPESYSMEIPVADVIEQLEKSGEDLGAALRTVYDMANAVKDNTLLYFSLQHVARSIGDVRVKMYERELELTKKHANANATT